MNLIGKKLKPLQPQTMHIQHSYKSLLSCMIIIFLKEIENHFP